MTKKWSTSGIVVLALTLQGCVTQPVVLKDDFWAQNNESIAVVLQEIPKQGELYKQGGQGLLDVVISSVVTKDVNTYLESLNAESFAQVQDQFSRKLIEKGFKVVKCEKKINLDKYPKVNAKDGYYDHDLSELFNETQTDKLLILQLNQYGAIRSYYGFIPLSDPQGLAVINGLMVEKSDNKILWFAGDGREQSYVQEPVIGAWDEPPNYPNLTAAVNRALARAQTVLLDKFFAN